MKNKIAQNHMSLEKYFSDLILRIGLIIVWTLLAVDNSGTIFTQDYLCGFMTAILFALIAFDTIFILKERKDKNGKKEKREEGQETVV